MKTFLVMEQVGKILEQVDRLLATGVGKDLGLNETTGEAWDLLVDAMADLHVMIAG